MKLLKTPTAADNGLCSYPHRYHGGDGERADLSDQIADLLGVPCPECEEGR